MCRVGVVYGEEALLYSFPEPHPFRSDRVKRFYDEVLPELLKIYPNDLVTVKLELASLEELLLYHDPEYVDFVKKKSELGYGYLDYGDTPAFKGCFEASSYIVGSTLKLVKMMMKGEVDHGFNPVGGLHHARRDRAAGFCIFNDASVAIKYLLEVVKLKQVLYIDIDAHHGDGVFYDYYFDKKLIMVDIHQDGRTLYPGTGFTYERGGGEAEGTKLNIPLMPGAGDEEFIEAWNTVEEFIDRFNPEFIILQAGADGLSGDPLTGLMYSERVHEHATSRLHKIAEERCNGRLIALGGGGYNRENILKAWRKVLINLLNL
ncbi:MAG: acetoin utilization protein AcuC [Aigarchaeota archaeon]|nr:acetoin utilization protein AcuC [Aigarchaeota archaeon]MCX8193443.1 acetoin utilization protein AcuC [Nitrososphaeria archaeon]MDW7985825.1 acetoin utilization protein AcuC [Nitrososphaerota archaeon]